MKRLIIKIACLALVCTIHTVFNTAYSQIIYTDINPDTTIIAPDNSWGMYYIDLNNDGMNDFTLCHYNILNSSNFQKIEMCARYNGAEILCDLSVQRYPLCVSKGNNISSSSLTWNDPWPGEMIDLNENGIAGHWIGEADKYIGVRIKLDSKWHYGWIRLDVPADAGSYTLKDFAYNSIEDQQITAGETGSSGMNDFIYVSKQISIYPNLVQLSSRILHFNCLLSNCKVRIYDVRGKLIEEKQNFTGDSYEMKDPDIRHGIYLIEIKADQVKYYSKFLVF